MSKYNVELDKVLFEKEIECGLSTHLIVKVVSYNENAPKLQLSRKNFSEEWEEPRFAKLGRLSFNELQLVLPVVVKGMGCMVEKTAEELIAESEEQPKVIVKTPTKKATKKATKKPAKK